MSSSSQSEKEQFRRAVALFGVLMMAHESGNRRAMARCGRALLEMGWDVRRQDDVSDDKVDGARMSAAEFDRAAYAVVVALVREGHEFLTMDDVAARMGEVPEGIDRRRLGNVMRRARSAGLISPVDLARSRRSGLHAHGLTVWAVVPPAAGPDLSNTDEGDVSPDRPATPSRTEPSTN